MENRLQSLTEKLLNEGVEKGKKEAAEIVESANNEKSKIINDAKAEATAILQKAQKEAAELKKSAEAEIKLTGNQVVDALKQEVVKLVSEKLVVENVKVAVTDKKFLQELIIDLAKEWKEGNPVIEIPAKEKEIYEYLSKNLKSLFNTTITIKEVNGIKAGLIIKPEDESYKLSFTEDEFVNFFKEFLRPKIVELLYGK